MSPVKYLLTSFGFLSLLTAGTCNNNDRDNDAEGVEGAPCYANGTCNAGLACVDDVCVGASSGSGGSSGGASGSGVGGGSSGSNGSGSGGSSAGSSSTGGSGGSDTSGSGGSGGSDSAGTGGSGGSSPGGVNLINNGDFSDGDEYWEFSANSGTLLVSSSGGMFCVGNDSAIEYGSFSLGYPPTSSDAFALEAGASYTLSYTVTTSYVMTLESKVGEAVEPYATISTFTESVDSGTKAHTFTTSQAWAGAGLVFNVTLDYYPSQICFDDVSLIKL